ncbi:DUF1835 domain-containing protein [Leptobacterium flavescens]|uniref:DUF1835 domain-containing protein n=1 Tax=Leptobacterium flavescens TaxID=472055 RepID=A0A6P0UST3_9FLAO|nr:DUF1835 domain-containing protein [Leptobacterium flavescens]NER13426.1 DUF1835 domain-containing protein [Leptobacterium flavescens]
MSKILHITNGDSFTSILQKLRLEGEIITWREMLCEGKTVTDVGSETFWKVRYDYLSKAYKVTKRKFVDFTLKEYRDLCNHKKQQEIILWFEYDLFCQINMIAVLSWLKKHRKDVKVSLVSSGKEDDTDKLYGLSELSEEKLLELYKNRLVLSQDDIEYADYIWQLYCSDNPLRLETFTKFNASQLKYLPNAIEAHIQRFPTVKNGLNYLENKALDVAAAHKFESKEKLVGHMLRDQGYYGLGDLQFFKMLYDMKPLFRTFNPVNLSKLGKRVLDKSENFYSQIKDDTMYLGGTQKYGFLYHEESARLLKL